VKIRIQRTRLAQAPSSSARSPPSACAAASSPNPQLGGEYEQEASPPPPFIPVCLKPPARTPHRARPPRRSRTSALPLLPRRHARRDSPAAARPPRPNNFQLPRHRRASVPTAADLSLTCRSRSPRSPAQTEPHQHPPPPPRRPARCDSPTAARLPRPKRAATLTNFNYLRQLTAVLTAADLSPADRNCPPRPPARPGDPAATPPRRPLPQRRARHTPTTNPCQTRSSLPPKTLAPERRKPPSDTPPLEPYNIRENAPATSGGTSSRDGLLRRNNM